MNSMQSMPNQKRSKVVKWSLIIGIVIVLNLFFNYTLSLVYPMPQYQTFCPDQQVMNSATTKATCVANGGQWTENVTPVVEPNGQTPAVKTAPDTQGYCNPDYTCQKQYDTATNNYNKDVFIILVVLGIALIIAGIYIRSADAVSIGLSFGGVLSLIIGSARYWSEAGNILKVCILAVALAALIWLGMKKFKN